MSEFNNENITHINKKMKKNNITFNDEYIEIMGHSYTIKTIEPTYIEPTYIGRPRSNAIDETNYK